jgi:hypothetical protein
MRAKSHSYIRNCLYVHVQDECAHGRVRLHRKMRLTSRAGTGKSLNHHHAKENMQLKGTGKSSGYCEWACVGTHHPTNVRHRSLVCVHSDYSTCARPSGGWVSISLVTVLAWKGGRINTKLRSKDEEIVAQTRIHLIFKV